MGKFVAWSSCHPILLRAGVEPACRTTKNVNRVQMEDLPAMLPKMYEFDRLRRKIVFDAFVTTDVRDDDDDAWCLSFSLWISPACVYPVARSP